MSGPQLPWDGFRVFTPERTWGLAWVLARRAIRSLSRTVSVSHLTFWKIGRFSG